MENSYGILKNLLKTCCRILQRSKCRNASPSAFECDYLVPRSPTHPSQRPSAMNSEWKDLETKQFNLLKRISLLEGSLNINAQPNNQENGKEVCVEDKLGRILRDGGVNTFEFRRVPHDYYERSFEERRDLLGAYSIDHLCKSIVMVNTQAGESVKDCSDPKNSKYYVVVIQYTARLNAEKVRAFIHSLNEGKIPKKRFNLRLAPEEEAATLTGYIRNAVTPIGMRTEIPVILSEAILQLKPDYFWLGGGDIDLKLGIKTQEFINFVKPFVVDCS